MPTSRKATYSGHGFAIPMLLILGLLVSYWLLTEWQDLPRLISSAVAALR